jgi:hypothetical protein
MTADEAKRELIETALDAVQRAQALDERETLTVDTWTAWYDATIPRVKEIRIIAGAMEVELAMRRGQQLVARGEQRGREYEVTPGVTSSPAQRMERSRDRMLGRDPVAVKEYIQTEARAGRVPHRKGAVHAVTQKRKQAGARPLIRPVAAASRGATLNRQSQARILTTLETIADGIRRSDADLSRRTGDVANFLKWVYLIPWLTIDRTTAGTRFTIDMPLRMLCETWAPRPELDGQSIAEFFATLRSTIIRKRKENYDERGRRRWSTEMTVQAEQTRLLDWIESELDRVPLMASPVQKRHTTVAGGSYGLSSSQREPQILNAAALDGVRGDAGTAGRTPTAG